MKIGIAADHGGFDLKEKLKFQIEKLGFELTDFGAGAYDANDDYPDFAIPLAKAVGAKKVDRGIVLCGSGVGACFTVNKIKGVRAALLTETYSAHQGVEHDDMNIICIGGRVVGDQLAWENRAGISAGQLFRRGAARTSPGESKTTGKKSNKP